VVGREVTLKGNDPGRSPEAASTLYTTVKRSETVL